MGGLSAAMRGKYDALSRIIDEEEAAERGEDDATTTAAAVGGSARRRGGSNAWRRRDEEDGEAYVESKRQEQELLFERQEVLLGDMEECVERLMTMGNAIGDELDLQAEMLDEVEEEVQDADTRMQMNLRRIDKMLSKSGWSKLQIIVCLMFVIIFLLFLVIYS
eukprot:TRINITY_DN67030_c3_g1_i1.p1 TRINITY_DN67030_c3_g1~~TRINITY_DN67030_c3_g1_i1.p1  ORF type:complete len:174 (+),score=72.99 TRINITY_DN67030_c3_g1_i1:33-524(+)